jgi:hypothetical protein
MKSALCLAFLGTGLLLTGCSSESDSLRVGVGGTQPPSPTTSGTVPSGGGTPLGLRFRVAPRIPTPTGTNLREMNHGDLDADGDVDLIVRDSGGSTVVLLNDGSGNFTPAPQALTSGDLKSGVALATGDVTGDGRVDLVRVAAGGKSILIGNGGVQQTLDVGTQIDRIYLAPVTRPGALDLVVWMANREVKVYPNRGGPMPFDTADPAFDLNGIISLEVHLADIDGNGLSDLVSTRQSEGRTILHLSDGSTWTETPSNAPSMSLIVAGDFTGDGRADLALSAVGAAPLSFEFLGVNGGTAEFAAGVELPQAFGEGVAADLDKDGKADIATLPISGVPFYGQNSVAVVLQGGLSPEGLYETYAAGHGPDNIEVFDVDGDGDQDLVVSNVSANIHILKNNGDATFRAPITFQ